MDETSRPVPPPVILLVEPNLSLNSLISTWLTKQGYRVVSANTDDEAVKVCKETARIDLLITDVFLFGASGLELSALVAVLHPSIKTLYLSSMDENVLRMQGVPKSASVLEKPLAVSDLISKVAELLGQGSRE